MNAATIFRQKIVFRINIMNSKFLKTRICFDDHDSRFTRGEFKKNIVRIAEAALHK